MPSAVAARRLEVFAAARADPDGFLRFDRERLRFSLGTSLADLAVPVEVAQDARAIVRGAASELALLLTSHHRDFVPGDDLDRLILREDYADLPSVEPRLGPGAGGGPDLRAAAQLGPAAHPALTGGIVSAWMGRGGRGRSLVGLWIELLRRAFEEQAASRGKEETPLLVAVALAAETLRADREIREALPAPPVDRYLRAAANVGLWLAARTGLARAWRDAGHPVEDPLLVRLEAALAPAPLLGGRGAVLGGGVTLYGCELAAGLHGAEDAVARLAAGGDAAALAAELAAALADDEDLSRRAEQAVAVARLRELLCAGLFAAEEVAPESQLAPLRALYSGPGALAAAAADDAGRRVLAQRLAAAAPGGEAGAALERASRLVKAWKQKDPAHAWGLGRDAARAEYAAAGAALLADLALERLAAAARRALSFRTGAEAEGGADAEWEAGRLYRLSARPGPILKAATADATGHLFADVKDFTRRTALLGQASMAELLRREFYGPILTAAKEHFGGMQHLADRGGVLLNNLLGDAVSFTGRVDAMVALAKAIRAAFAAYALRLGREVSDEVVARRLAAIEDSFAAALGEARRGREAAEAAAAAAPAGAARIAAAGALERARAEEARVAGERARALSRARGEVLEAGTFVSYGPAPLVVAIDDEVFGHNRVAIAEKINESARGTARAPAARARADVALAQERALRGSPSLAHAWSVFVGAPLALPIPAEAEAEALRLWRAGDGAGAARALSAPVREALAAAAREGGDRPGDVYNSGAALSAEALEAFLAEVGGARDVRRVTLAPEEIPDGLRARWFFGDEPQELVICLAPGRARVLELFRRVGRAAFKGLGEVVVWELCADDGGPAALTQAFAEGWARPRR